MTTTEVTPVTADRVAVERYAYLDRRIKELEEERDRAKPAALEAIQRIGGQIETDLFKAVYSVPTEVEVDLTQLQAHVSVSKFAKLTRRTAIAAEIRAHVTAGTFSAEARKAIKFVSGTPRIVITRKVFK